MRHKEEIVRWANSPDGTKVWEKLNSGWHLSTYPAWSPNVPYIVDDEWAELRKAQADGKQLQYCDIYNKWVDRVLDVSYMNTTSSSILSRWKIKPEPVYEDKMTKGQIVAIKDNFGNIQLLRYHSKYNDTGFNVYLNFGMSTEHKCIEDYADVVDIYEVTQLIEGENVIK